MELNENIVAVETYLNTKPEILSTLRDSRGVKLSGSFKKDEFKEKATAEETSERARS